MWVIVESVWAGLTISLINKYTMSKNLCETCMTQEEEDGSEVVSVATGIS